MRNPPTGPGPRMCYVWPSEQVNKYKKVLMNDRDFMNEFKPH